MFCYQCEQTAKGEACTVMGVCGKQPEIASLQDLLVHVVEGLSLFAEEGRKKGVVDAEVNVFTFDALFSTLTNVNYDPQRFAEFIRKGVALREQLKEKVRKAGGKVDFPQAAASFTPGPTVDALVKQGEGVGINSNVSANTDIRSLQHTLLFGMKGICAYAEHAEMLGRTDDAIPAFLHEALAALARNDAAMGLNEWLGLVLKCGEINLKTMGVPRRRQHGHVRPPHPHEGTPGHEKGARHPRFRP